MGKFGSSLVNVGLVMFGICCVSFGLINLPGIGRFFLCTVTEGMTCVERGIDNMQSAPRDDPSKDVWRRRSIVPRLPVQPNPDGEAD